MEVAAELEAKGIPATVDQITGVLHVRLPMDHPLRGRNRTKEAENKPRWPRKPEDRVDFARAVLVGTKPFALA
jgi:hypothetical protein